MFVSIFLILVHYFRHGIFIQSIFFVMTEFPKQMFLILENFGVDITFFFFFLLRTTKPSIYMPWPKKYTPLSEITIKSLPHPKLWSYWGLPFSRGEGSQESIDIQPPLFFKGKCNALALRAVQLLLSSRLPFLTQRPTVRHGSFSY